MPFWASWLRDIDILNIFYEKFKSEKMAKFETLIVPRGLSTPYSLTKEQCNAMQCSYLQGPLVLVLKLRVWGQGLTIIQDFNNF